MFHSRRPTIARVPTVGRLMTMVMLLAALPVCATPYHSVTGHYTIDLPDGWVAVRPTHAGPANDVPVTRGGTPMVDVLLRPQASKDPFPPIAYIAIEPSTGRQTDPQYEDDTTPGSWQTQISPDGKAFQATRRVPLMLWMEQRTDVRGWISPTAIVTLSISTTRKQFDAYEPAFRHIAESYRADNPGLLIPSVALLAVAATVMWVARRGR